MWGLFISVQYPSQPNHRTTSHSVLKLRITLTDFSFQAHPTASVIHLIKTFRLQYSFR